MALFKNSPIRVLEKFIDEVVGCPIEIIRFPNQPKKKRGRPDAEISSNFQILIESKIDSKIDIGQIERYKEEFNESADKKILIIITKYELKDNILNKNQANNNFITIKNITRSKIYEFFDEINNKIDFNDKTRFLSSQFCGYLESILIDKSWKNRVVIVPGEVS